MFEAGIQLYNYMETFFCCTVNQQEEFKSVITEHMLVYVCQGELDVLAGERRRHLKRGQAYLIRKNHKAHKIEYPSKDGTPFKGLFLQLKQPMLKKTLSEYRIDLSAAPEFKSHSPYVMLPEHPLLTGLFASLESWFDGGLHPSEALMEAKIKEVILTLVEIAPELKRVLFDFKEPFRTDLAAFMDANFASDLDVEGFAHYTGRSLSAFKKEFGEIFGEAPGRWLINRRLEEAKSLIERGGKPLDVYLEVGFKNLSHFSTAFKRRYGFPPSAMQTAQPVSATSLLN